jgi:NADH dehydrogenase [ubiquinone] 1 alpha subcomplex assembly factor 5
MNAPGPPEIFDRRRRRALRQRAGRADGSFLWEHIADDLAERLASVTRSFESALFIGPIGKHSETILGNRQCTVTLASLCDAEAANGAPVVEEDRLPFETGSFDLVVSAGTLDSVNDLPGAFVQMRRLLKADGLLLAHMFGAGSGVTLKALMIEVEGDRASPHLHPQIDLRSAADLLSRSGFALPVADQDVMKLRYRDWRTIVGDIRSSGLGNALAGPRRFLGKDVIARLDEAWSARAGVQGTVEESLTHIYLSGWSPSPFQPKPAPRGSGQVSLASIFPTRD